MFANILQPLIDLNEAILKFFHNNLGFSWGLAIVGLRRAIIPLYVAVCVAVIGAVGPFVGSAAFIHAERVKKRGIVRSSWQ